MQEMFFKGSYRNKFILSDPDALKKCGILLEECERSTDPTNSIRYDVTTLFIQYLVGNRKFQEAVTTGAGCLENCWRFFGYSAPETVRAIYTLGFVYERMQLYHTALLLYNKCSYTLEEYYPEEMGKADINMLRVDVMFHTGMVYAFLNDREEAADRLNECYEYAVDTIGKNNTLTLEVLGHLALLDDANQDYEEGCRKHEEAFYPLREMYGYSFGPTVELMRGLADNYLFVGKAVKAVDLYREYTEFLISQNSPVAAHYPKEYMRKCEERFGKYSPETLKAGELLLWTYSKSGSPDKEMVELCDILANDPGTLSVETVGIIRETYARCGMKEKAAGI